VLALGVVEGDTEDLAGIACALEKGAHKNALITEDGLALWGGLRSFHDPERMPCEANSRCRRSSQASDALTGSPACSERPENGTSPRF